MESSHNIDYSPFDSRSRIITIIYGFSEENSVSYLIVNGLHTDDSSDIHEQFHKLMERYLGGSEGRWHILSTTSLANKYRSETTYILKRGDAVC